MYSLQSFYEFCSKDLILETDIPQIQLLKLAYQRVEEHNEKVSEERKKKKIAKVQASQENLEIMDYHGFESMERLTDRECKIRDNLNVDVMYRYVCQESVEEITSLEAAINELLKETTRVYGWYQDVEKHKENLLSLNKSPDEYAKNYWYFMEWQNDCFGVLNALVKLNDNSFPSPLSVSNEQLKDNFSILCGTNDIESKDKLLDRVYYMLETAYAWAYIDEESKWLPKTGENSNQQSFVEQLETFVKLVLFVEKHISPGKIRVVDNIDFNIFSYIDNS